jgi:NAD(P)-dependent dehydrogenase (short-subunit alcohol dehydrogenase family)
VKGKTVLVTGANTGIGLETAAGLAGMGATVVLTSRDPAKGAAAVDEIRSRSTDADVTSMTLDLSSLAGVRAFAATFSEQHPKLDVLINNAGLILDKRTTTEDGYETTFQVNHLGPFLLTNLLLPNLEAAAPSRIVNVASTAHRSGKLDLDDLQTEKNAFRSMRVYGTSKLCNILFTRELAKRLEGTGVVAHSLHPGTVRTGFGKDGDTSGFFAIGVKIGGIVFKSPAQGARTSIHVASSPEAADRSGSYWVNRKVRMPSVAARSDDDAERLWDESCRLVGLEDPS